MNLFNIYDFVIMHKYTYYSVNKASCCIITLMDHYYLLAYIGYYSNNVIIIIYNLQWADADANKLI